MSYIAAALWAVFGFSSVGGEGLQRLERFVQRDSAGSGNVEDLPGCFGSWGIAGEQIGLDGVVDVGEVTALFAVPENGRLLAVQHLRDELRQHARVGRRRILSGAKNVEVAQGYGFESIT